MRDIMNSIKYIEEKITEKPEVGLILGSGLGDLADEIENPVKIKYEDIPDFPVSTVEGHAGQLVFGKLSGKSVVAMQGRFHFYEGYDISDVVYPVKALIKLGIKTLIVTNAAGGVNTRYEPGDLMIINDHLNLAGQNPLIGKNIEEEGPRFPDMTNAYTPKYIELAKKVGKDLGLDLKEGVYTWMSGPTYETPAEVRMIRNLGGDAAGMSTVPEVIVAKHQGIDVLGISCITNMAAGVLDEPLRHEDVVETSQRVKTEFQGLIKNILKLF